MSSAINLAAPEDGPRVLSLMQRYHEEAGLEYDDAHREAVGLPLLDGSPLGAVWLIGPTRAPLGYIMVTFGWSAKHGGMISWLEEIYIRDSVRGRGIGTETLHAISVNLGQAGMKAMHVALPEDSAKVASFCGRCGFAPITGIALMTDPL